SFEMASLIRRSKSKALPDGTQELFERIFGERHFSWKCFIRSAAFSLGAMAFIGIVCLFINPAETFKMVKDIMRFYKGESTRFYGDWFALALWLPWSILIDYVSLFKTRLILGALTRLRRAKQMIAVAIVVIDLPLYTLIFTVGIAVLQSIELKI